MSGIVEYACFELYSITGADLASWLVENTLRFTPKEIRTSRFGGSGVKFRADRDLERLARNSRLKMVEVTGPDDETFTVTNVEPRHFQGAEWCLEWDQAHDIQFVHTLSERPGFTCAYMADTEDVRWQTQDSLANYETYGKDHSKLPKVKDPESGRIRIDTSVNPGGFEVIRGMWLMASWRMWFGGRAFQLMPKERLLSFPDAQIVEELPSGAIFIQLDEHGQEPWREEHRRRQQAFRDWVAMDELPERAAELWGRPEAVLEIHEQGLRKGVARKLIEWQDQTGEAVPKSRASQRHIAEFDKRGNVVAEWVEPKPEESG